MTSSGWCNPSCSGISRQQGKSVHGRWLLGVLLPLLAQADSAEWSPLTFDGKPPTRYQVSAAQDRIEAWCDASASGLIRRAPVTLAETPLLRWRWRAETLFEGLSERERGGDDFPVRVYVVRDGGWAWWRSRSVVYVWSASANVGDHWPNPYTDRAHVFVVQSGPAQLGQWSERIRDVRADFVTAFGEAPAQIDGLAVMTDCDDSGLSTHAMYADLRWARP